MTPNGARFQDYLRVFWPVFTFMLVQTGAAVWWASDVTSSLRFIKQELQHQQREIEMIQANRYTSGDAIRDHGLIDRGIAELSKRLYRCEEKFIIN